MQRPLATKGASSVMLAGAAAIQWNTCCDWRCQCESSPCDCSATAKRITDVFDWAQAKVSKGCEFVDIYNVDLTELEKHVKFENCGPRGAGIFYFAQGRNIIGFFLTNLFPKEAQLECQVH